MSHRHVIDAGPGLQWIDVVDPSRQDLRDLADEHHLFPTLVEDSLQPEHLPKFEKVGAVTFIIVRSFDPESPPRGRTVQQLTRKLVIFCGPGFLITIHRQDQPFIEALRDDYNEGVARRPESDAALHLLIDLLNGAVDTYEKPLEQAEADLDRHEDTLFTRINVVRVLREIHELRHRINVVNRMLWHTLNTVVKLVPSAEPSAPLYQDLRENVEHLHLHAESLLESANTLLHLQLGLASHRTNEIVRVLTLFSVFFMPLTFIVGIYGMNFRYMPELQQRWGYPAVLVLMALVSAGIYIWFRRRGWLRQ